MCISVCMYCSYCPGLELLAELGLRLVELLCVTVIFRRTASWYTSSSKMIISRAPCRMDASCALGKPPCAAGHTEKWRTSRAVDRGRSAPCRSHGYNLVFASSVEAGAADGASSSLPSSERARQLGPEAATAAKSIAQMRSRDFIVPRSINVFFREKRGRNFSPRFCHHVTVYWKTVGMVLVLLASFASPKWH